MAKQVFNASKNLISQDLYIFYENGVFHLKIKRGDPGKIRLTHSGIRQRERNHITGRNYGKKDIDNKKPNNFEEALWDAANMLRGSVESSE